MIASVDYYALLGIQRTASAADVRAAYKREVRIWQKRAAASSEGSVRDEAEKRLALLAEAFGVLSDAQRRVAYDRQPIAAPVETPSRPVPTEMASRDWIEQAEEYLAAADYYAAARSAREVTANQGNSAEGWLLLSRANAGLRQLDDAVYDARRAIELAPENSMYHFNLGGIYEELGRWDEALRAYEQASQREPTESLYQLAIGGVWLQNNQPAKAMPIIERVYSTVPDDEAACYYYAQALLAMAEAAPRDKSEEGYAVTSASEIQAMREYLSRATGIKHLDQQTKQVIHDTEAYLSRMEGYTFHIPMGARSFVGAMLAGGGGDGCANELIGSMLIGAVLVAFALAPLLFVIGGFAWMTNGSILGGFVLLLIGGGLGYGWYRALWVPRWKVNARLRDHRIRYLS